MAGEAARDTGYGHAPLAACEEEELGGIIDLEIGFLKLPLSIQIAELWELPRNELRA